MHVALEELRLISERKDVARLVLYLKELIPDYNPGSQLLKLAMSATASANHSAAAKTEGPHRKPATLLN
jgi:hypothetical protein